MFLQSEEDNFCNYYLLPLLKLDVKKFGIDNFINSFIDVEKGVLLIKIKDKEDIEYKFWEHKDYITDYQSEDCYHITFKIPKGFENDLVLFREGQYSKLSTKAKSLIKSYSGLSAGKKVNNKQRSDFRILILDKHPELRKKLEENLNVKISKNDELASKPLDNNYWKSEGY